MCAPRRLADVSLSRSNLEFQMEGMLGRLRELELEKQQLEARQVCVWGGGGWLGRLHR
jgi:hypothetical protein